MIQQGAPRKGWAIIRGGDDTTRLHRVGDAVADGITLSAIAPRHVLLDHDGRLEKLTLDQRTALKGVAAGPEPAAASDDARGRLIESLGLTPIRPGMAAGYRVENPEGGLALKYGFLEGDEILSVNGYPLGTAEDDRLAYHVASRADVAQLRVRRGDREIRLEYHADQDRIEGLDAQVKKFQDDQDVWRIGFKVTDASVSGGLLCSLADLSGMPWYLADSSTHDNFGNDDGVVWPGPIQGNIGTLEVLLAGSSVASNIHAHGVSYDNVDTFSLTGDLYNNGTDTAQGCSLSGDLTLDSPVNYLTVF
ncbi:hypothetical protein HML84_05590 [Alcanivorax sp. IO_7]|nr:hypothetical protein HML84_05590 [Alcanivorax sp. IO_7]